MRYGICFNTYEHEIYIYAIYNDGSRIKIMKFYEKNNYIHLDIVANNFKFFNEFNNISGLTCMNMVGVDLSLLYSDLLESGIQKVNE